MEWQGGVLDGCIAEVHNGYEVSIQKGETVTRKFFSFARHGSDAKEKAFQWRKEYCHARDWVKSPWKHHAVLPGVVEFRLTNGETALIDQEDLPVVDGKKWYWISVGDTKNRYVATGRHTYLHKILCPNWEIVDHIDRNGLNNCRSNLRQGMNGINQNNCRRRKNNTSGKTGVYLYSKRGRRYCMASWRENSKNHSRTFSGENAFQKAVALREEKERELGINNE